jgi:CRISPR-associated protein Cas5t
MVVEKTLLIEIFQPFAQYRNPFTFYYAQTYPLPPKSTIIGMFQNATDKYYDNRFWNLKVSVHGGFESVFWNYQQLIKGEVTLAKYRGKVTLWNQNLPLYLEGIKSQRTPVYQQELFNGHLFIFVKGNEDLIEIIKSSLENPKKVLYLGRSEDVIFLKNKPKILEDEGVKPQVKSVKKSLWLKYPTYIKLSKPEDKFPIRNDKFPVYSIPVKVEFKNNERTIINKAELNKNTKRVVEFETVIYTGYDYVIYLEKEVKIERYKIDDKRVFKIPKDFGWL